MSRNFAVLKHVYRLLGIDRKTKMGMRGEHRVAEMEQIGVQLPSIWLGRFCSKAEFENASEALEQFYKVIDWIDDQLLVSRHPFYLPAFCVACGSVTRMRVDWMYGGWSRQEPSVYPAWTETCVCERCGLSSRMRAAVDYLIEKTRLNKNSLIFIAEQLTPTFQQLKSLYPRLIGSEFLGPNYVGGNHYMHMGRYVRHEDLTSLSFEKNTFEAIITLDVFEHIPNVSLAFKECYRVLRSDGELIFTVPFFSNYEKSVVRASVSEMGEIVHYLPPEIHGNPISPEGCLCFHNFGWDILVMLRDSGFRQTEAWLYWGPWKGHMGYPTFVFHAVK